MKVISTYMEGDDCSKVGWPVKNEAW